jgi:hypothetical protein
MNWTEPLGVPDWAKDGKAHVAIKTNAKTATVPSVLIPYRIVLPL